MATNIYKLTGGMFNSEKETLSVEDPWYNWHMPEDASGTMCATSAQWQGQQLLCPLASAVVAVPHHADPVSLVAPSKWGQWQQL